MMIVKEWEYSENVGHDLVTLVRNWKMIEMRDLLTRTRKEFNKKTLSPEGLAQFELKVVEQFSKAIQNEIRYEDRHFDLAKVIANKKASCLGYSQLFYIVGRAINMQVQIIEVRALANRHLAFDETHSACLFTLANGDSIIVNNSNYISKPFVFRDTFGKDGHYWQLNPKANSLLPHKRIRFLNTNGIIANILTAKGNEFVDLRRFPDAISLFDRAVLLDPNSDVVFHDRGNAYYIHKDYKRQHRISTQQ